MRIAPGSVGRENHKKRGVSGAAWVYGVVGPSWWAGTKKETGRGEGILIYEDK